MSTNNESSCNFQFTRTLDLGLAATIPTPHFAVDKVDYFAFADLVNTSHELEALALVAEICKSSVHPGFLPYSEASKGVFDNIFVCVEKLNKEFFDFEIWGINSGLTFVEVSHNSSDEKWQVLRVPGETGCKLIAIICVSSDINSEDGFIELLANNDPIFLPFRQGCLYLFPSWTPFRFVAPRTGERLYATCYAFGPSFR